LEQSVNDPSLDTDAVKRRMVVAALAEHYTTQTTRFTLLVVPIIMAYVGPVTALWDCNGCGRVRYCSPNCQINDWKNNHKHECPSIRTMPPFPQ